MPRLFLQMLVPTAALATFVVGSTLAWSNNVSLNGDQAVVKRNPIVQPSPAIRDFDTAFASRLRKADREVFSRAAIKVDFNQAFADASVTRRRDNTPMNREKLRNTGWTRIDGAR